MPLKKNGKGSKLGREESSRRSFLASTFMATGAVLLKDLSFKQVLASARTIFARSTAPPTNAHNLLLDGYNAFAQYLSYFYGLSGAPVPEVPITTNNKTLTAYLSLSGKQGKIIFEVHEVAGKQSLWICAPHPKVNKSHLWYEFVLDSHGKFQPNANPHLLSTPYPFWGFGGVTGNSKDWAGGDCYGVLQGVDAEKDPPHWSPIFVVRDQSDWTVCKTVHDHMWKEGDTQGQALINAARPTGKDLTDRAKESWPPFTLRGLLVNADIAGEDYWPDHTCGYLDASGNVFPCASQGNFLQGAGIDWDMSVDCDNDVTYLSTEVRSGELQVEIEAWALGAAVYRPKTGTWLQATGRWIVDCGCEHQVNGGFHAEIHPPELLAWSTETESNKVHLRTVATGAWLGAPLRFVVFPPPRPTVNSALQHSVHIDKEVGCKLDVLPYPEDNPNHLVCRISATNHDPIKIFSTGMVAMTDRRSLQAMIDCWWEEQTATLKGKVGVAFAGQPAVGTHILYYDPDDSDFPVWQRVEVDNHGQFSLAGLKPKDYIVRPAGSGWDFYGVPKKLSLSAGINDVTFVGVEESYTDLPPVAKVPMTLIPIAVADPNANLEKAQLDAAARQVLVEKLISWDTNIHAGEAGVKNNNMGLNWYAQEVEFDFHLASLVDGQGNAVLDFESAIKSPQTSPSGAQWYLNTPTLNGIASFIIGSVGPGVAGAKLQVRLVLGNETNRLHPIEELEAVTDELGNARFTVEAGSHPEDVSIYVLVQENPVNPWFRPVSWGPRRFFYPDNKSDDTPQVRAAYHFKRNIMPLSVSSHFAMELAVQRETAAIQRRLALTTRSLKKASWKASQIPPSELNLPILPIKPRP